MNNRTATIIAMVLMSLLALLVGLRFFITGAALL